MDAPQGSVELEEAKELEALRRRAYGPDADIAGDPAAQARLSELEAARADPIVVREAVAGTVAQGETARGSVWEHEPSEVLTADPQAGDEAPMARWVRPRRWLAILGGAIATLALIAIHLPLISQLGPESSALPGETPTASAPPQRGAQRNDDNVPAPDNVLSLKSVGEDAHSPNDRHGALNELGISLAQLKRYEDFEGLNVWSGESTSGMTCLLVAVPVQGLREGYSAEECSPEGLDIIANLPGRGEGGLTQLVLWNDHVDVYVYVRDYSPSTSQG